MSRRRPKDIGTEFESGFVRYASGFLGDDRIHRAPLHGRRDEGDIHGIYAHGMRGIAECKAVKGFGPSLLRGWKSQTLDERGNADADFALLVVHVRGCDATGRSASFGRNACYVTLRDLARIDLAMEERHASAFHDEVWVRVDLDDALRMIGGIHG